MKTLCQAALLTGLLLSFNASACYPGMYFWDTDGPTPGPGGNTPSGTWNVGASWNADVGGAGGGTIEWPAGQIAVFSAGDDATGAYTISVQGTVQAADIHVDSGQVTFDPDPTLGGVLDMIAIGTDEGCPDRNDRLLSVGHKSGDTVATYNVAVTGANGIIRYKWGKLVLGATNTFTGTLKIEGGIVQCTVAYTLAAANPLVLANNDTSRTDYKADWRYTPSVFDTGGLNQRLGTLKLAGSDVAVQRIIDFGDGASALVFADSSTQSWVSDGGVPIALHITNYTAGVDSLRFGTSAGGLTKAQLALIRFDGLGDLPGKIDANGFVTPAVPVIQSIRRNSP
jgi:autotransporter-associated beta strand protein